MANQRENRFIAAVKVIDDGTITARTAGIAGVEYEGTGSYLITLVEAIGDGEETHTLCCRGADKEDPTLFPAWAVCERVSSTQYRIRTFVDVGSVQADDAGWAFTLSRVAP